MRALFDTVEKQKGSPQRTAFCIDHIRVGLFVLIILAVGMPYTEEA